MEGKLKQANRIIEKTGKTAKNKDRRFMEIAIEEMLKSKSEHTNKSDPMVGAILIDKDGNELGRAHRGGLRIGDHAEFTLIERLLGNKNLENSILFVTLEPCSTRQAPKKPCAERIVSARIAKVFIGMPDPNPAIQGHGINHLIKNRVVVDFFDIDLIEKIEKENSNFIEQYEKSEGSIIESLDEFEGPSNKEREPVLSATLDDLSHEMIQKYLDERKLSYDIPSDSLWSFFQKIGLITLNGRDGQYIPTVAGLLLFGKNPEDILVQSKIKAEAHHGERIVTLDITGSLLTFPDKIEDFLNKNLKTYTEIKGFKRVEVLEYPIKPLREAIINAIVHRDYMEGARIIIQILQDRIIIKSPGLPPRPISLEKIRNYNAPAYSRNPRIAETFHHMHLMEERGWGFKRMHDGMVEYGLQPPEFNFDCGYFVVAFSSDKGALETAQIAPDLLEKLNDRQKEILVFIRERGNVSRNECIKKFKAKERTIDRDLKKLIEIGVIEKKGKGVFSILEDTLGTIPIVPALLEKLNNRQRRILAFIYKKKRVTSTECINEFKISQKAMNQDLKKLIEIGVIEKRGKTKAAYYVFTEIS